MTGFTQIGTFTREDIEGIGGSPWSNGTVDRVYLNDWESWIGLDVSRYKSGNVNGATLGTATISNRKATLLTQVKVYWANDAVWSDLAAVATQANLAGDVLVGKLVDEITRRVDRWRADHAPEVIHDVLIHEDNAGSVYLTRDGETWDLGPVTTSLARHAAALAHEWSTDAGWKPNEYDGQRPGSLDGLVHIATWSPGQLAIMLDEHGEPVAGAGGREFLFPA